MRESAVGSKDWTEAMVLELLVEQVRQGGFRGETQGIGLSLYPSKNSLGVTWVVVQFIYVYEEGRSYES